MGASSSSTLSSSTTAEEAIPATVDLRGRVALVTGASSGVGEVTARVLAQRGAHVYLACRSRAKTDECIRRASRTLGDSGGHMTFVECDLSSFASVRSAAAAFIAAERRLDVLVLNAGIMMVPFREFEGYESQFTTNHLSHFLLARLLDAPLRAAAPGARVVVVSSMAHSHGAIVLDDINMKKRPGGYDSWRAYGTSKMANVMFALRLARTYAPADVTVNAVHPGVIRTNLGNESTSTRALYLLGSPFLKSISQGAATQCAVAAHPSLAGVTGRYFADCRESSQVRRVCLDEREQEALWKLSADVTGVEYVPLPVAGESATASAVRAPAVADAPSSASSADFLAPIGSSDNDGGADGANKAAL